MDIDPARLQRLIDKDEIRECVLAYARGLDREDGEILLSGFHAHACDDHGSYIGPMSGFQGRAAATRHRWQVYQHHVTNQTVDIDGDTAHAETYYLANLVRPDGPIDLTGGRYIDRLERIDGRWGIVERITMVEWGCTVPKEQTGWLPPDLFVPATHGKDDPSYRRPLKITRPFRDLGAK